MKRTIAVKVLYCGPLDNPRTAERFLREAECLARLSHPNLLHVYDFGSEDELHYFVMELLIGATLATLIRVKQRLAPEELLPLAGQLLLALHYVHRQGVTHRDLKPGNIMVCDRRAVLMDFGLARVEHQDRLTSAAVVLGTPEYMAPEQAEGSATGPAADLYSLGIVLYEALAGVVPFQGRSALAILKQHLDTPPPPLVQKAPGTPPQLAAVIHRLLAKRTNERYPDCPAVAADLAAVFPTPELVHLASGDSASIRAAQSAPAVLTGQRGSAAVAGDGRAAQPPLAAQLGETLAMDAGTAPAPPPAAPPAARWVWALAVVLLVVCAGALFLFLRYRRTEREQERLRSHRPVFTGFSQEQGDEWRLVRMTRSGPDPSGWSFEVESRKPGGEWQRETIRGLAAFTQRFPARPGAPEKKDR